MSDLNKTYEELEAKRNRRKEKIRKIHREKVQNKKREEEEKKKEEEKIRQERKRIKIEGMKRTSEEAEARKAALAEELKKKRELQEAQAKLGALKVLKRKRVLARRAKVAELYCKCYTLVRIAEIVGVSTQTVINDVTKLRNDWLERCRQSFDEVKAQELSRLDHLESKAWEGYDRSFKDKATKHKKYEYGIESEDDDNGDPTEGMRKLGKDPRYKGLVPTKLIKEIRKVGQAGDPRYLEIILRCIESRSKICGLFKDDKSGGTTGVVVIPWAEIMRGGPGAQLPMKYVGEDRLPTLGSSGTPLLEVREGLVEVDANEKDKALYNDGTKLTDELDSEVNGDQNSINNNSSVKELEEDDPLEREIAEVRKRARKMKEQLNRDNKG